MSGINGRGNGGGGGRASSSSSGGTGVSSIPTGSRKIVQNLKEIVNYPELEIYTMLKECNMDPSETINRLLNQDTFQEVKSKREKKKEVKDTSEAKARTANNTTSRGGRVGNDRAPRLGSSNLSSNDYGTSRGKFLPKKDNVLSTGPSSSILGCALTENAFSGMPCSISATSADTTVQLVSSTDDISLSSKPVGAQHAWSVRPGQVSMADIVRMGRLPGKLSSNLDVASEVTSTMCSANLANDFQINANHSTSTVLPSEYIQEWSSHDIVSEDQEAIHNPVITTTDGHLPHDGQLLIKDLSIENKSKMPLTSISSEILVKPSGASSLHYDNNSIKRSSYGDGVESTNSYHGEGMDTESDMSDGNELAHSRNQLTLDKASLENTSFYNSQEHTFESFEVDGVQSEVPSITSNFQHLSIQNESHGRASEVDTPAVIFPEHLQVTSAECSHLSFGSFRSDVGTGYSSSNAQEVVNSGLEQTSIASDAASFHHMDTRITEFYNDEQSKPNFTENVASRASEDAVDYNQSSSSQITGVQTDIAHSPHEIQYNSPTIPHVFSSTTQSTAAERNYMNTDPTTQIISSLSGVMQAYASSVQSNFLASNSLPGREFDASYLSLLATQSTPTKYDTGIASVNQPTISLSETLKSSFSSASQATTQNLISLESSNIPAGASVPQHLPVHPYSQPALPLGQLANIMGYPFLTPSYTYLPSASFPSSYTDSAAFHQSRSAAQSAGAKYTPPQYRSNISLSSLAQNAAVPSGYGCIGSSDNISGSFALNPPSVSANTATSFDDILASQYKQGNPYASLQQSEISNMWLQAQGGVSRTVPSLPANAYYNLQGQSQHSGFGQIQQQPSHYGAPGYPNFYHTQVGVPQERQSNSSEVANSNNSHGLPSQSSHHLWQNNY